MTLRITSPTDPERVDDVLRRVINEIRQDDTFGAITIVTPTQHSVYYLGLSLAEKGLFNVTFSRLEDVAERIVKDVAIGERLTDIQASEYVYQVALDSSLGTLLGGERYSPQLQSALHSIFREMERLDQGQLDCLSTTNSNQKELVTRFNAYKKLTANRKYAGEIARQAAEIVSNSAVVTPHSLTALGTVVLVKAAPLPFELQTLFDALSERPDSVTINLDVSSSRGKQVRTFGVPTVADEIREVTRQVVQLARDGESLSRTAILFEDDSYANRIAESLQAAGVKVCGPNRTTLKETPEGRFILGLLNVFESDFDRLEVTAWFSSSTIGDPDRCKQPIPSARWDAISRSAGVVRSAKTSLSVRLDRYQQMVKDRAEASERTDELGEGAISAADSESKYARRLKCFIQKLASRDHSGELLTWEDFVAWLNLLIDDYLITDKAGEERLSGLLKRLTSLDRIGVKPSLSHCIDVLREQLDRKYSGTDPLKDGGVYIGPLWTAVVCPFDHVFILGMTERRYPTIPRTDPLIPEHVKIAIDPKQERLLTRSRSIAASREQFQLLFASAGEIRLFWPRSQPGQARQMGPSRWFITELQLLSSREFIAVNQLINHEVKELEQIEASALPTEMASSESDLGVLGALEWVESGRTAREFPLVECSEELQRSLKFESERSSLKWTEFDGKLQPEEDLELSGSATAFETYAACPYKYFISKKLKLEPTKSPENLTQLDPLTFGSLIHEVLEKFSQYRLSQPGRSFTREEKRGKLFDGLKENIAKLKDEIPGRSEGMWELEFSRAWSILQQWLSDESLWSQGMTQEHAELQFGYGDSPPVEIQLDSGAAIRFRGQIDRVDVSNDKTRVHVYDYKSGSSNSYGALAQDPVKKGTKIQLPLYSIAARRLYPDVDLGASYWFIRQPTKRFPLPENYDETKARHRFGSVVKVIADGVTSGTFPANPGNRRWIDGSYTYENCAYCEFKKICPENKATLWRQQKNSDSALSKYVDMTERDVG